MSNPPSLSLDEFWPWLKRHFNCIVRVGGGGFVLYDMHDAHWHLTDDPEDGLYIVQLYREKELCAEVVFRPDDVVFVQLTQQENEQTVFDCIGRVSGDEEHASICHFLLSHGYDGGSQRARWRH